MNTELIKLRKSVRTYDGRPVEPALIKRIEEYIKNIENPLGITVEFKLLDAKRDKLSSPVVTGEKTYVGAKILRQADSELAFGYSFESFVLYAASLGLGTVWLAGTLDRFAFEKAMELEPNQVMIAASPIGYPAEKRSIRDAVLRKSVRGDERAAFDSLFFAGDFSSPLSAEAAGKWALPLEMVRWAPSATNKQPWRVVVCEDCVHFYQRRAKGYERSNLGDIQKVDMGIAMCHFRIAAGEQGMEGVFLKDAPRIAAAESTEYIISYKLK